MAGKQEENFKNIVFDKKKQKTSEKAHRIRSANSYQINLEFKDVRKETKYNSLDASFWITLQKFWHTSVTIDAH